jgi:hypothetical protein
MLKNGRIKDYTMVTRFNRKTRKKVRVRAVRAEGGGSSRRRLVDIVTDSWVCAEGVWAPGIELIFGNK